MSRSLLQVDFFCFLRSPRILGAAGALIPSASNFTFFASTASFLVFMGATCPTHLMRSCAHAVLATTGAVASLQMCVPQVKSQRKESGRPRDAQTVMQVPPPGWARGGVAFVTPRWTRRVAKETLSDDVAHDSLPKSGLSALKVYAFSLPQ